MSLRRVYRCAGTLLMLLVLTSVVSAFAAANTVPRSALTRNTRVITINDLKPPECAHINVTHLVLDGNGGNFNGLFLGTPGNDTIRGGPSNDCIVGGGGNDVLQGNQGDDVLIAGPGSSQLNGGPGTDHCYGRGGSHTYVNCAVIVP
jgi:hypothetical protein